MKAPIVNVTNALAGQLPGLQTKQQSGMPGSDDTSLSIRGFGSPLVIVDGIESGMNNIDPNQIESISILKDGAASIYGARAREVQNRNPQLAITVLLLCKGLQK